MYIPLSVSMYEPLSVTMQLNDVVGASLVVKSVNILSHHCHHPALGLQALLKVCYSNVGCVGELWMQTEGDYVGNDVKRSWSK